MSVKNYKDVMELKAKADALGFQISIGNKINLIKGEVNIKCDEVYEATLVLHGWQLCKDAESRLLARIREQAKPKPPVLDDGRKEDNA